MRWVVLILSLYALSRFCHHQTAGFSMAKIKDNTFPMDITSEEITLKGEFRYLGRGLQSFSFVSEDGEVVLKIFNNRYQQKLFWYRFLPFTEQKKVVAESKLKRNFNSYKIAYEELQKETGILYFHPKETHHLHQTITLVDKLGIKHPLDLDTTSFIVQKKATLFYPYLDALMEKNDLFKAKEAISAFVTLLKSRLQKGIGDNDALVRTNFGFVNDVPIHVDVGPFYRKDSLKTDYKKELIESTLNLKHWLEAHHPPLATHFDEIIKEI
jgi:hypothetical protein